VRALMARVRTVVPPELSRDALRGKVNAIAAPAVMEIRLRDGRTLNTRVEQFRGAGERPLTDGEVSAKFHECAGTVFAAARVDRIESMVGALGSLADAAALTALLAA
jgi:hypothetical protein